MTTSYHLLRWLNPFASEVQKWSNNFGRTSSSRVLFVKRLNRNGSAKLEKKMKVLISENSMSAEGEIN